MSHYLGRFFMFLGAAIVFVFSVSLSYSLFSSIQPANMPWFVWAAMGLTEFGLLCWIAVFMLTKHHPAEKTVAILMIFACLMTVFVTDAIELAHLFGLSVIFAQVYYYVLIVMLLAHLGAFVTDWFIWYFSIPGHSFTERATIPAHSQPRGNLIPAQQMRAPGNLIPSQVQFQRMIDQAVQKSVTGYLTAVKVSEEEPAQQNPLQLAAPDEAREPGFFREWATGIKEDVSSLMKKVSGSIKSGRQAAPAPGDQSETTDESGLQLENGSEEDELEV